jgi:tetratricopeptide (TPR) repeat protein
VAQAEEPFPDAAFHMASPQTPDLVHLSAIPEKRGEPISALMLLQAYEQLMIPNPEYRGRYFALAKQLESTNSASVEVLEGRAALALEQKDDGKAIECFRGAVKNGSTSPQTYEQLASLLVRTKRFSESVNVLEAGIKLLPYDAALYRLLGISYLSLGKKEEARGLLRQAVKTFPQDRALHQLLKDSEETSK